jgi:hypothetical protein
MVVFLIFFRNPTKPLDPTSSGKAAREPSLST